MAKRCPEGVMIWNRNRGWAAVALAWAMGHAVGASGQMAPVPPRASGPPSAILVNPYLNPYLNPYVNPAAALQPMTAGNAALFLYSAQAANGGIGSGRISGTRPDPVQQQPARASEMPYSSATPGAGASRYFNPGPVNVNGAGRYYNRRNRYFQNNGR